MARRAAPRLFLLVILLGCSARAAYAGGAPYAAPASVSDMLVVGGAEGASVIYLADEEAGKIWWHASADDIAYPLDLDSFKELEVSGLTKPSGLAYHNGHLLVCDIAAEALLSVDLKAGKTTVLLKGSPLREPTRVTVSPEGVAAIGSSHTEQIVLFELATKKTDILKEGRGRNEPNRLLYADGRLIALNERGKLYSLGADVADGGENRLELDDVVAEHIEKISDFALTSTSPASLFVIHSKGVAMLSMSTRGRPPAVYDSLILPIHSGPAARVSPSVIASVDSDLYVADAVNRKVWKYRHVQAKLDGTMQQSNEALVSLYAALDAEKTLPTLQVVSQERQNSLQEFLLERNVLLGLLPNTAPAKTVRAQSVVNSSAMNQLGGIVCRLNSWTCDFSESSNTMKWRGVGMNERVWIPYMPYSTYHWTSKETLDKTVNEYLDERIPYKEQRDKITAEYLWILNDPLRKTLEYQAAADQLILASPSEVSFEPGSLIRVENNRELRGACADNWVVETSDRSLGGKSAVWQREMKIEGWADYLPHRLGQQLGVAELVKLGVESVSVKFDEPVELRARLTSLQTRPPQCWDALANQRHYVVVDALKVSRGTYELQDKARQPIRLDENLVSRLGLMGSANAKGQLVVEGPYVVAYRPALWGGATTFNLAGANATDPDVAAATKGSFEPARKGQSRAGAGLAPFIITDPKEIKPGSSQDVFGRKAGKFTLPILRWRLDLLAEVGLFANQQSALRKTARDYKGVFILPAPADQAQTANQSLPQTTQTPAPTPDEKVLVEENRGTLKKTIDYPAPEILTAMDVIGELARVRVGIVEKSASVDDQNADFITDPTTNESAWLTITPEDDCVRLVVSPGEPKGIKKEFKQDEEHGTHVAGIIAANKFSWVPGLAAAVELLLVDVTRVEELETNVQFAIDRGVSIFNISQSISGNDSNSVLMTNMADRWTDRLFIAAAGNKALDFNRFPPNERPIKYRLRNLIGVGAADRDGKLLETFDEGGKTFAGTNYGEEYVQLLAPGRTVYSTARGSQYISLSGSSQAVPQVTAAAAMILAQGTIDEAARIKARLIYTTNWSDAYLDRVWGGLLDFKRAVWEPQRNLFYTSETDPEEILAIDVITNDAKLTVSNDSKDAYVNEPNQRGTANRVPDRTIPFRQILRIQSTGAQRYRVIYFDKNMRLRIIMNAELKGEIEYKAHKVWDKASRTFKVVEPPQKLKLSASKIVDYVAAATKTPNKIEFF